MMRIGLLSDIHANLAALESVLQSLQHYGVDQVLVAGDLVGYGAQPNECVTRLAEIGANCVSGNHDLFVLDRLPATRFPPLARRSAELTRSMLTADVRAFLGSLPIRLLTDSVMMTHGSLDDPEEYVDDTASAVELLSRLPHEAPGADTLILGHTHRQWCVSMGKGSIPARARVQLPSAFRLINPGSVGQSRQRERRPGARFAIYETARAEVDFIRVDYDVDASLETLRRLGLPTRCVHSPPSLRRRVTRLLRRMIR